MGYGAHLDSDMASELTLAQHLCREGTLVSSSWYYSTEIRLLSTQLVYTPLMALFPHDWRMVRTLGNLLLAAALAGACCFAARQAVALSRERDALLRALFAGFLSVTLLVNSVSCVKNALAHPQYLTDKRMAAVEAIRERGLSLGYATFWSANIVTELSDGEIEVVALEQTGGGMSPLYWMEAEESFAMNAPEEPVFLLLGVWEEEGMEDFLARCRAEWVELDGWINLYEIPSQRLLLESLTGI